MQKLLDYVNDKNNNVHCLSVIKNGRALTPYDPVQDKRFPVYSATKSILSIGIGALVGEGRLDINAPLADYLTSGQLSLLPADKREAFCALPVTRFLTMSLKGYPFRPEGENAWLEQALTADVDYEQTPSFSYSNFPALLAGVAAQNAAGEPLSKYLDRVLFSPLGIDEPPCKLMPEGFFYGASGMYLSLNELSRIGTYLLDKYKHDSYLSRAVSRQIACESGGYGYFLWVGEDCFYISGKWGQKCVVFPERQTVITYLSHRPQGDSELFALALDAARE